MGSQPLSPESAPALRAPLARSKLRSETMTTARAPFRRTWLLFVAVALVSTGCQASVDDAGEYGGKSEGEDLHRRAIRRDV